MSCKDLASSSTAQLKVRSRLASLWQLVESRGDRAPHGETRLRGVFRVDRLPAVYRERLSIAWRLARQYRPGQYRGRLTLLRCRTRPLIHRGQPDLGWGHWVHGPVEIRDLPGTHRTVLSEPYIHTLAGLIHQIMRDEDEATRTQDPSTGG